MNDPKMLDLALEAVDADSAGHWPTVAGVLAFECRKAHTALREIIDETNGSNPSHIGQDRAFSIARQAIKNIE